MPRKAKAIGRPRRTDNPTKLTIALAGDLKKALRIRAVEEGRTGGELVSDAVRAYLKRGW